MVIKKKTKETITEDKPKKAVKKATAAISEKASVTLKDKPLSKKAALPKVTKAKAGRPKKAERSVESLPQTGKKEASLKTPLAEPAKPSIKKEQIKSQEKPGEVTQKPHIKEEKIKEAVTPKPQESLKSEIISKPTLKTEEKKIHPPSEIKPKIEEPKTPIVETLEEVEILKPGESVSEENVIPGKKVLQLHYPVSVKDLAEKFNIKANEIIKRLIVKGVFANINQSLTEERVLELAGELGIQVERASDLDQGLVTDTIKTAVDKSKLVWRAPIVTLMGHVDHGKTSLLDAIRKSHVTEKEHGGITQHIGAYSIKTSKGSITFLDTPGHEAFTAMRARGANATDIVILVVGADDGVMPQTKEAIDHARAAEVPIVVAINKCDLPTANVDKVKKQLAEINLLAEDWGGKNVMVKVSAKTGAGIDELLEMILLEADLLELKADPTANPKGVVIEGRLSAGQGPLATILVQNGTLKLGDVIVSGLHYGKVRAMINDVGHRVKEALPSTPVEVIGLKGVPEAGDEFYVVNDERKAIEICELRNEKAKQASFLSKHVTLEHLYEEIQKGTIKELKLILKGDVQGSVEALEKSLNEIESHEVRLKFIHSDVGNINESDVILAMASNAVIIGFHVRIEPKAQGIAEKEGVEIKLYNIIYEAIEDVKASLEGLLEPIIKEIFIGRARVQQVFKVSNIGIVAGSVVIKGKILRGANMKLVRNGANIYEGKIISLKRLKDDAKEVPEGVECGIGIGPQEDIKPGDIIEAFKLEKVARRL